LNELLARIIEAHGGMDRWKGYEKVEATIVSGGGFFGLKGTPQDSALVLCFCIWSNGNDIDILDPGTSSW
jgi:hypothetical protein